MVTTAKISLFLDIIKRNKCYPEGSLSRVEHQEQYLSLALQFKNKELYFILPSIFSVKYKANCFPISFQQKEVISTLSLRDTS